MLAPTLRDDLGISNTGYASILTAFLLAYTFMQPVTGWLIDRIGTRLGFALIMGWWSAAAILHAFGTSVATFAACRFLLGMGEAGSWAACVKAVSEWFPRRERGLATGLWSSGVATGLVVSVPIVAWISLTLGWQWAFILTGLTGFAWLRGVAVALSRADLRKKQLGSRRHSTRSPRTSACFDRATSGR